MPITRTLTVGDLAEFLSVLPTDAPLAALYDCRCASGDVVAVELGVEGYDGHVVLVID